MHSTVPAAKRRRFRHIRNAARFWLFTIALLLIGLVFFDMVGR